jgi:hypothetical protein
MAMTAHPNACSELESVLRHPKTTLSHTDSQDFEENH